MPRKNSMKLLFITQKMNKYDSALGFTHRWVTEFAKHFESITVLCLEMGEHSLPSNVRVFSMGKERKATGIRANRLVRRLRYLSVLFGVSFRERKAYDAVFVHMNEEYAAIGGLFWRLLGKKVFLWRNHYLPRILVDVGAIFCTKVFCTSRSSYTAKFKKTVIMPVGVDVDFFKPTGAARQLGSVLFLARMAPAKRAHILIEALAELHKRGVAFTANLYGGVIPKDEPYLEGLKKRLAELRLEDKIKLSGASPYIDGPKIYSSHEVYVNLSLSGMYDKTIFEAAGCEALVLATSLDFAELVDKRFIFAQDDIKMLADKLEALLKLTAEEKKRYGAELRTLAVEKHSLDALGKRLYKELTT